MFTDNVKLRLEAGKGGNGIVAWRREKYIPKGGPAGGDGGRGGSIIFRADGNLLSLENFRHKRLIRAENGEQGGANNKKGRDGQNLILKRPPGTLIKDADTGEILFDLTQKDQEIILCKGGKGGKGNTRFKTSTNQAPNICTMGTYGQGKTIELELKLIADIGLVGMPNAGKSTLLSKITKNPVKIGAYPFTTLQPNLGLLEFDDYSTLLIADIPGIIARAHENKGLGISFLKHIERTETLIFIIDISGIEERDPFDDFITLRKELAAYNKKMLKKPFLTLLNKIDAQDAPSHIQIFKKKYSFKPDTLFEISALKGNGLKSFTKILKSLKK